MSVSAPASFVAGSSSRPAPGGSASQPAIAAVDAREPGVQKAGELIEVVAIGPQRMAGRRGLEAHRVEKLALVLEARRTREVAQVAQ